MLKICAAGRQSLRPENIFIHFSGHEGHLGFNHRVEGQVLGHFLDRLPRIDDVTVAVAVGSSDVDDDDDDDDNSADVE